MERARKKLRQIVRLLRIEQVPTAAADSAAGALLIQPLLARNQPLKVVAVIGASLFLYTAGMVFNDLAHVKRDRELHPDRPLPSGKLAHGTAYVLGATLFLLGLMSAAYVGGVASVVAGALGAGILLYNYDAATHPIWGPGLMSVLRAGNFILGCSVIGTEMVRQPDILILSLFVGAHILFVTLISVLEESPRDTFKLKAYAFCDGALLFFLALYLLLLSQGRALPVWLTAVGFGPLVAYVVWLAMSVWRALDRPSPKNMGRIVGTGVQGLILVHATLLAVLGQPLRGGAMLLLFVPIFIARWM